MNFPHNCFLVSSNYPFRIISMRHFHQDKKVGRGKGARRVKVFDMMIGSVIKGIGLKLERPLEVVIVSLNRTMIT